MDLKIPEKVNVSVAGNTVKVTGPQGNVEKTFSQLLKITSANGNVTFDGAEKALLNTAEAHMKNMFTGVTSGFQKKLKIIYAHFPITIEVKGKDILIKNFLGEKQVRKTSLVGDTKLQVKGQEVVLSGADKDALGGTFSNIKKATKIRFKDGRVFQDGIYPVD